MGFGGETALCGFSFLLFSSFHASFFARKINSMSLQYEVHISCNDLICSQKQFQLLQTRLRLHSGGKYFFYTYCTDNNCYQLYQLILQQHKLLQKHL